ncbi:beta-phosphoglucomutase family hydrolase [Thaumasiovibrio sp. DFM-14]|uniref:beta-phosphoglucomutase family hydrolase n=1 Tax=Thaumasiovibrio sp. DFM-14 TaxID=3384792 RepID=UPI0039A20650
MIELDKYEGVIFDMDGTLIDSMPTHLLAWEKTAEKYGFPFEPEWFYQLGGTPTHKTARKIQVDLSVTVPLDLLIQSKVAFYEAIENKGELIPATYEVLLHYAEQKPIAIGTGSQRKHAEELLESHNLMHYFNAIVTANDVKEHKPHPETFIKAATEMGLVPSACVVFEDTWLGAQAAKAAGMDCYLVQSGEITQFIPRD